jgi:hypothetical protein
VLLVPLSFLVFVTAMHLSNKFKKTVHTFLKISEALLVELVVPTLRLFIALVFTGFILWTWVSIIIPAFLKG